MRKRISNVEELPGKAVGRELSFRLDRKHSTEDDFIYMLFCVSHTRQVNGSVI